MRTSSEQLARRWMMASPISEVLQDLAILDELATNLEGAIDAYAQHVRMAASLSPEVTSQFEALNKAREGLKKARTVLEMVRGILAAYPDDKTAQRSAKDADVMVRRFERAEKDALKMIHGLSKKAWPAALKKLVPGVQRGIEQRLVDPSKLQVIPWQSETQKYQSYGGYLKGVAYQVVFRIVDKGIGHSGKAEIILQESTVHAIGPHIKAGYGDPKAVKNPAEVVQAFLAQLDGWPGLKGQADAIAGRAGIAADVASALNSAIRSMRAYDEEKPEISRDNRTIEGAYRSDLPKEGAYAVGEYEYEEMVEREIARWRRVLDPKLRPYMASIKDIQCHDGEKSWIYTTVTLK